MERSRSKQIEIRFLKLPGKFADKSNYFSVKNDFDSPDLMLLTRAGGCTR